MSALTSLAPPRCQDLQCAFLKAVFADRVGHARTLADQLERLYPQAWPLVRADALRQAIIRHDPIMCALMLELGEVSPLLMVPVQPAYQLIVT